MSPLEAQKLLGFHIMGHRVEFVERDGNLHKDGQDYLGTSRSGARPATVQEEQMWDLLMALDVT